MSTTFGVFCGEVSLYLQDDRREPDEFEMAHTPWSGGGRGVNDPLFHLVFDAILRGMLNIACVRMTLLFKIMDL